MSHGRSPGKEFGSANQSICEWSKNGGRTRNKTVVEIDEAKKALELFDGGGLRIVSDGLNMRGKRCHTGSGDVVAKEINSGLSKRTLFGIHQDTIGGQ